MSNTAKHPAEFFHFAKEIRVLQLTQTQIPKETH